MEKEKDKEKTVQIKQKDLDKILSFLNRVERFLSGTKELS